MTHNQQLGRRGEDHAAVYLQERGLVILERNWRCAYGEIDIVAREGSTLVLCEVKTRSSAAYGLPVEAISPRKLRRMRHLAYRWLAEHMVHAPVVRLDVVSVLWPPTGPAVVEHLVDVDADGAA